MEWAVWGVALVSSVLDCCAVETQDCLSPGYPHLVLRTSFRAPGKEVDWKGTELVGKIALDHK